MISLLNLEQASAIAVSEADSRELKHLNDTFRQAAKEGKYPDNVHAAKPTWEQMRKELGIDEEIFSVSNPVNKKVTRAVADDVPEGRYFFSDDTA